MSQTSMTYLSVSKKIIAKIQQTLEIPRPIYVIAFRAKYINIEILWK